MEKALTERRVAIRIALFLFGWFFVVHMVAFLRDWYRIMPWIDIPFHIAGGIIGTLVFYWVFEYFEGYFDVHRSFPFTFLFALSVAALGGVLWEFFEFFYDYFAITVFEFDVLPVQLGLNDTLFDLVSDLIGASLVAVYMRIRYSEKYK